MKVRLKYVSLKGVPRANLSYIFYPSLHYAVDGSSAHLSIRRFVATF